MASESRPAHILPRILRSMLLSAALIGSLVLVLGAPANAAAGQVFYFGPDEKLALAPGADLREPLSSGVTVCAASACARHTEALAHRYTFEHAGNGRPMHSNLWIDVTQPMAGSNSCSLELYVELLAPNGESKWYWDLCPGLDIMGMGATPGLYEVSVDWPADYNSKAVEPGDELYAAVWTASNSLPQNPTAYLVSDAAHPSTFTFSGIDEPVPVVLNQTIETSTSSTSAPTTSSMTTSPSTAGSTTTGMTTPKSTSSISTTSRAAQGQEASTSTAVAAPPSKASPVPGILIAVGLLSVAEIRRRL